MDNNCTIYKTVDIIAKRWSLLIILEIFKGPGGRKQFTDLKHSLHGITPKILSTRLKELQAK